MAYQVLARRLRPQTFDEIVGQEHVTRTLRGAIEGDRVAHAFLFAGPRGVGKTTTARILAKALTCDNGPTPDPCNACSNCREVADGTAIDVLELDGASNRGIDDAREIVENVRYRPAKSRFKLYIIDEVHQLTKEAFNALLKTLEEPPPHVKFIFATTEPDKVLPTIVSRCQRYDFRRLSAAEIRDHLQQVVDGEKITVSAEGLFLIAREADGSVRDGQSLLEQVLTCAGKKVSDQDVRDILGVADRSVLYEIADAIIDRDPARCLTLVGQLYRYGYDVRRFCRDLLEHLRNLMVAKLFDDEKLLSEVPPGETERVRAQAARRTREDVERLFRVLLDGEEEIGRSLHPKLVLEMTLVRLSTLEPVLPLDEITARLEDLAASLGSASPEAGARRPDSDSGGSPVATDSERARGSTHGRRASGTTARQTSGGADKSLGVRAEKAGSPVRPAGFRTAVSYKDAAAVPWADFLALVQGDSKTLYMTLATSRCVALDEGTLTIGVESDLYARELSKRESRTAVAGLAERFFGRNLAVEIQSIKTGSPPLGAGRPAAGPEHQEHLKRETLEHPTVRAALDILGGEVRAVQPKRNRGA